MFLPQIDFRLLHVQYREGDFVLDMLFPKVGNPLFYRTVEVAPVFGRQGEAVPAVFRPSRLGLRFRRAICDLSPSGLKTRDLSILRQPPLFAN